MVPWLRTRLSVQMFLQYAIWGAWAPVLAKHLDNLGFSGLQIGSIYGTGALANILAPLIAGQVADRWFASQRFLAVSYLGSGVLFLVAAATRSFQALWWLSLATMIFYGPTLAIANSLSFHHLADARKQFPAVRVWGTIGWIVAGWVMSLWLTITKRGIGDCLLLAGIFSILNALYCVTLPHTPPKRDASEKLAVGKALSMLRDPSFALFSVLAFCLYIFGMFYFTRAPSFFGSLGVADKDLSWVMGIGQIAEILTVLALPFVYLKLGVKKTIAIGLAAWALRFAIFSVGSPKWLVIAAQSLHGVCFAFALAAAMIYVERVCASDARASAQGFLSFVTYGLGMFAGAYVSGLVSDRYTVDKVADWRGIWMVPAIGCAAVLAAFVVGFRSRDPVAKQVQTTEPQVDTPVTISTR